MAVQCPYCRHELSLKTAPPGMYTTACTSCARKFYLAVPEDSRQQPIAAPIPAERAEVALAPHGNVSRDAPRADRAGEVKSEAADSPGLTLPEHTRLTPTLPGPAGPSRSPVEEGVTPIVPGRPFAWARLGSGSVPRLLGGYLVLCEVGRTSLGPVYLARQLWLNRDVNLKVMKLLWARNAPFVARFTREAFAVAQLRHENLAQIHDFGESKGATYFCTERVEGQHLGELIVTKRRIGAEEAACYVVQAVRGLRYAHDQSVIHRDIKPENLWLDLQGRVKVADLGLVNTPELAEIGEAIRTGKALAQGAGDGSVGSERGPIPAADASAGTPGFMVPEQLSDPAHVDARADIYSLGCVLYCLVTGRPPFEGRSRVEILSKLKGGECHTARPACERDPRIVLGDHPQDAGEKARGTLW